MALQTSSVTDPQATLKKAMPAMGGFEQVGQPMVNMQSADSSALPATQTFGQNSNLIGTQINPGQSANTQSVNNSALGALNTYQSTPLTPFQSIGPTDQTKTRGYLDQASGAVNPSSALTGLAGMGGTGSFGYGADTGAVRGQLTTQLTNTLNNTPDRAKLAGDTYDLLLQRNAPQEFADDRRYNQSQVALGRKGSGMFNSGLADIATQRETTRDQARRQLATESAGLSLQDQLSKLGAAQGTLGTLGGLDQGAGSLNLGYLNSANAERGNAFNRQSGLEADRFGRLTNLASAESQLATQNRNDLAAERDARQGYDQNLFNRNRNVFTDTAGYGNDLANADRQNQNDLRGERNYQYGLSRDAQGDTINQYGAQEGQYNTGFNQGMDLFNAGYGNQVNPSGVIGGQAGEATGQAGDAIGGIGDLLGAYGQYRASQTRIPRLPTAAFTDYLSGIKS